MPALLSLCLKYYNSRDLYEVLQVDKNASEKDIKKAYHRLSLKVHPDRVSEEEKLEATEKFKVLGKVHSILSDRSKKLAYDETGAFDEEEDEISERNWKDYWRMLFKPITEDDIVTYERNYKGSELEMKDLKKAYLEGEGDMDYITDSTPFARVSDEPRLIEILQKMIDDGEVPEYELFINEPEKKKATRHKKAAREAQEVENLNKMIEIQNQEKGKENDLAMMIRKRQQGRAVKMDDFFDQLAEKYGGGANSTPPRGRRSSGRSSAKKKK
ncbi:J domain-containing protein CG6693 [Arctopsyche grandis]|uniref:J domain-containing protein CG6693 n=1 Tax=Arctopsyche grandis TaxID=121162 RepID=UPI00406D8845